MGCYNFKMPCLRFVVAFIITFSTLIFACTMLALEKTPNLTAFYTSLISACVSFWMDSPKYSNDDENRFPN